MQEEPEPAVVVPVGQAAPVTTAHAPVAVVQHACEQGLTVHVPPGSQRLVPTQPRGSKVTEHAPATVQHAPLVHVPEQVVPKPRNTVPEGQPAAKTAHAPVVVLQQAPMVLLLQLLTVQEVWSGFQALIAAHWKRWTTEQEPSTVQQVPRPQGLGEQVEPKPWKKPWKQPLLEAPGRVMEQALVVLSQHAPTQGLTVQVVPLPM